MNNVIFAGRTLPLPPTIVCGDFNVDLLEATENAPLIKYFDHIGLKSKLPRLVTTTGYTQIDNVFSNMDLTAGTYCALFSYHSPLWIQFRTE